MKIICSVSQHFILYLQIIIMNGLKESFRMSRRERRGTIVILALIAVLLVSTQAVRSCGKDRAVPLQVTEIEQFEADADSVTFTIDKMGLVE